MKKVSAILGILSMSSTVLASQPFSDVMGELYSIYNAPPQQSLEVTCNFLGELTDKFETTLKEKSCDASTDEKMQACFANDEFINPIELRNMKKIAKELEALKAGDCIKLHPSDLSKKIGKLLRFAAQE